VLKKTTSDSKRVPLNTEDIAKLSTVHLESSI